MHTAESKWDADEIVDTRALQLFALKEFMKVLNYEYVEYKGHPHRFESKHPLNKGRKVINFNKAVKLYNGNSVKCVFGRPPSNLTLWSFNDYVVTKAKASRILVGLKLQMCTATKQIIVQDHRVQFTMPSYSRLFLNNKYL
jgi:hypothetical protein